MLLLLYPTVWLISYMYLTFFWHHEAPQVFQTPRYHDPESVSSLGLYYEPVGWQFLRLERERTHATKWPFDLRK